MSDTNSLSLSLTNKSNISNHRAIANKLIEFSENQQLLLSKHEKKIEWSKQAIVDLFEQANNMAFKYSLDDDTIKVSICDKGSPTWKYCPLIKTELVFEPGVTMD